MRLLKTKYKSCLAFLLMGMSAGICGRAANAVADTTLVLQEAVVIGAGSERSVAQSPGSIHVITPWLLRNSPAQSADDILTMISGVHATRSDGVSSIHSNVSIRGLAGDEQGRTLVLFDGIPINTSDEGSVNWNSIHLDNVQRIEVFKGPGSSLYGNNAMGGVINIVSRKPRSPLAVHASGAYGSLATRKSSLGLSGRLNECLSLFVSGYYNRSDGFNNVPGSLRTDPDYSTERYMKEGGFYAKVLITPGALFNVDLSYDLYRDKRGEGEKIQAPDGEFRRFNHHRVQGRFYGGKGKFSYNAAFYFQRQAYFRLDESMKREEYQRFEVRSHRDDGGVVVHTRFSGRHHELAIGGEYKNGSVNGGDHYVTSPDEVLNRGVMTIVSVFGQEELSFWKERLWLQAALRYDYALFHKGRFDARGDRVAVFQGYTGDLKSNCWGYLSPRVALRFNPGKQVSVYFSCSQGFRAAILDDLCRSGWMWVGPKIANPDLEPEKLVNYEIGGNFWLTPGLSFSPSFYYARGKDFLYYIATGDKRQGGRDIFRRENVSHMDMKGLEADIDCVPCRGLRINLNYSYNDPRIRDFAGKPELNDKVLTYAPENQVKGYILWTGGVLDVMVRGRYKSGQYTTEDNTASIAAFTIWDVLVSKWFFRRRLYIGAEMINVSDNRHMTTKESLSAGRLMNVRFAVNLTR